MISRYSKNPLILYKSKFPTFPKPLSIFNISIHTLSKNRPSIEILSLLLQNKIIRSLCDDGLFQEALSVYRKNRILGCFSDNYTYPFVIKACSVLGILRFGEGLHGLILKSGFGDNIVVKTSLVDLYAKCGCVEFARSVFDEIAHPDLVSWGSLISGYSLNGRNEEVVEFFREIRDMDLEPSVSILATVIPVCTRSKYIYAGKSLHGFAVKSGHLMDESLIPALISLYSSDGDLRVARSLFENLVVRNVAVWNAMISAYTNNQNPLEALQNFKNMLSGHIKPNVITYLSVIPSCVHFGCIIYGESLHACLVKVGLVYQISVSTSLLSMYAKVGEISASEFLFSQMRDKNLLSWNSLISAYVHNMRWDLSLAKVREMQIEGFKVNAISIISVLTVCCDLKAILLGKSAHGYSVRNGLGSNLNLSNSLLSFYSICRKVSYSFKLFNNMAWRNIISWNTLISGFVHVGDTNSANSLLKQMQKEGMSFDLVTLISILPCYNEPEELIGGMSIHSCALKMGFDYDVSLSNALISMYFNCLEVYDGKFIFENMLNKSVVSWNAIITGYRNCNFSDKAMIYFYRMIKEGHRPNYVTLLNVLPACYALHQGKCIHAHACRRGIELQASLVTSLILMYARFGATKYCRFLFELGEKMNISLWNAVISAHVQTQNAAEAVDFFLQLLRMKMKPDHMSILSLISACVQLNNPNIAKSATDYVIKTGFDKDVAVTNALIDLYAKLGNISIARELFNHLIEKDKISWSIMINGYGLHGDGEAVIDLVSQMDLFNINPDDVTYLSILSACSHTGLVEQGRLTFESMLRNKILPRMEHYACIIDLLARTGHIHEAYDIVKRMPQKPSISLLESLLGACIVHGEFELGEEIGMLLIELDPKSSGSYVMMHNVYASAGRWAEANNVRSVMDEKQLRKVPGFSLI